MKDIVIRKDTDLGFEVYQGCKRSGHLGFDEMLGLIASLTMPDKRAHPTKSVAKLTKYQRYAVEKERNVPYSTQLASECLQLGVK